MSTRPTWAEISRHHLLSNYRYLRQQLADEAEMLVVVKANAYGHGLEHCAPALSAAGAEWLGVTSVDEGVEARQLCPESRILAISGPWHGDGDKILDGGITPSVWEHYQLDIIEEAAARRGAPPQSVAVHLELDTGMSRQGVPAPMIAGPEDPSLGSILQRFHASSPLRLEGIMTHFSAPEDAASAATRNQLARLACALDVVAARRLQQPRWLHAGNSATVIGDDCGAPNNALPALRALAEKIGARLMVRPGLTLYGYAPRFSPGNANEAAAAHACHPVLSWKTRVVSLRTIAPGQAAGYNETFVAKRPTTLALLPLGYADGLNRLLSNRGEVLVRGQRAPIAGRVSMDQTILDVTDVPGVSIGDEVVILGTQGKHSITAYDHADLCGTIPWEILCDIAQRVPRNLID